MILIIHTERILFTAGQRPNNRVRARPPSARLLFPSSQKQQGWSCISLSEELGKTFYFRNLSGTSWISRESRAFYPQAASSESHRLVLLLSCFCHASLAGQRWAALGRDRAALEGWMAQAPLGFSDSQKILANMWGQRENRIDCIAIAVLPALIALFPASPALLTKRVFQDSPHP